MEMNQDRLILSIDGGRAVALDDAMPAGSVPLPEGYLGSTARIVSGPAPELVESGYRLELADGEILYRGFGLADLAHVLELCDLGIGSRAELSALSEQLLAIGELEWQTISYDERYGDVFNVRERMLEHSLGSGAGWLSAGRPRREAGRIAFRIAVRERLIRLIEATALFAETVATQAEEHAGTLMPDYTYLQTAQATTFGHYLLSFAYPALRAGSRLKDGFRWVNSSPAGAGGVCGSSLPVDRARLADRLGFDDVVRHTRDAMWQTDGLVDLTTTCSSLATNISQLAEDLEIYGSSQFGLVQLHDSFCRASALMPQKRNPYALTLLRAGARQLLSAPVAVAAAQQTPSARTDNLLHVYGAVPRSIELATRMLSLGTGVVGGLSVQREKMRCGVSETFAQAADLADAIMISAEIDYRSAYKVVGRLVADCVSRDAGPETISPRGIKEAAEAVLGHPVEIPASVIADALNAEHVVRSRTVVGGAAPGPMQEMVRECHAEARALSDWVGNCRERVARAEASMLEEARALAASGRDAI